MDHEVGAPAGESAPGAATHHRRRAARTVVLAYAIDAPTLLTSAWFGLLVFGLLVLGRRLTHQPQLFPSPLVACMYVVIAHVAQLVASAGLIYLAPLSGKRTLWYVRTDRAEAAMITTPDSRRRSHRGDILGAHLGAWPKHRGAGMALLLAVRDQVCQNGQHMTLTASRSRASMYRRQGFVDDGHSLGALMVRLVYPPRSGNAVNGF